MRRVSIDLSRVELALHGVSAAMAEEAVAGLEEALRRRLAGRPPGALAGGDSLELAIGPVAGRAIPDAGALRGIIADRLAEAILMTAGGGD